MEQTAVLAALAALVAATLTYTVARYVSALVIRELRAKFGISVGRAHLFSLEGVSYVPPLHMRARTKVECVEIHRVGLSLHWPSFEYPSVLSFVVDSPYVQVDTNVSSPTVIGETISLPEEVDNGGRGSSVRHRGQTKGTRKDNASEEETEKKGVGSDEYDNSKQEDKTEKQPLHPYLLYIINFAKGIALRVLLCSVRVVVNNIRGSIVGEDGSEYVFKQSFMRGHITNEKFDISQLLSKMYLKLYMGGFEFTQFRSGASGTVVNKDIITHRSNMFFSLGINTIPSKKSDALKNASFAVHLKTISVNEVLLQQAMEQFKPLFKKKSHDKGGDSNTSEGRKGTKEGAQKVTFEDNISKSNLIDKGDGSFDYNYSIDDEDSNPEKLSYTKQLIVDIKTKVIKLLAKEISVEIDIKEIIYIHEAQYALKSVLFKWHVLNPKVSLTTSKKWTSLAYTLDFNFSIPDLQFVVISEDKRMNLCIVHRKDSVLSLFAHLNENGNGDRLTASLKIPKSNSVATEAELPVYVALLKAFSLRRYVNSLIGRVDTQFKKYVDKADKPKISLQDICAHLAQDTIVDFECFLEPQIVGVKIDSGETLVIETPLTEMIAKSKGSGILQRTEKEIHVRINVTNFSLKLTSEQDVMTLFNFPLINIKADIKADGANTLSIYQKKFTGLLHNSSKIDNFIDTLTNDVVYDRAVSLIDTHKLIAKMMETTQKQREEMKKEKDGPSFKRISSTKLNSNLPTDYLFKSVSIRMEGGEFNVGGIDNRCMAGLYIGPIEGSNVPKRKLHNKNADPHSVQERKFSVYDKSSLISPIAVKIPKVTLRTKAVTDEDKTIFTERNLEVSEILAYNSINIYNDSTSISADVEKVDGVINIRNMWIALKAYQFIYEKYARLRNRRFFGPLKRKIHDRLCTEMSVRIDDDRTTKPEKPVGKKKIFTSTVSSASVKFISTDVTMRFIFDRITITNATILFTEGKGLATYGSYDEVTIFHIIHLYFDKVVTCSKFNLHIPYGFSFYNVLDSIVHFIKMFKTILPPKVFPPFHAVPKIPHVSVSINEFLFDGDDYNIEVMLTFLAQKGKMEQIERIERYKIFDSKLNDLKKNAKKNIYPEVRSAYEYLQKHNSRHWIDICKKHRPKQKQTLSQVILWGLKLELTSPTLETPTCEQTLHAIDPDTPLGIVYMDMYPLNVRMELCGAVIQLRDYPVPVLNVPRRDKPVWVSTGLLILAEEAPNEAAKRYVNVDTHYFGEICKISRSVYPMKFYADLTHTISVNDTVRLCFGPSMEPCLQEFVNIVDQFTKPNVDPSPPIGWWDKFRLIFHGKHTLKFTGGARFALRMTGTMSPYFRPDIDYGSNGFELLFGNDVKVVIGGDDSTIVIDSGFMYGTLATNIDNDHFMRCVGGVRMDIGVGFDVEGKRRRHSDIRLRTPAHCKMDDPNVKWDSFRNFRSRQILLNLNITSKRSLYSGLTEPNNWICLGTEVLYHFKAMGSVLQSPLTNISREGEIWKRKSSGKPKLGRTIGSISTQVRLSPLLLGFHTFEFMEDAGVGIRFKTENFDFDMNMKRETNKIEDGLKHDSRKSGKFNMASAFMRIDELEGRTLTFGDTFWNTEEYMGDPFSLELNDLDDDAEWIIPSDRAKKAWRMTPFFWTLQVTYFLRNDDPEQASTHTPERLHDIFYTSQILIYQGRLRELESLIARQTHFINLVEKQQAKIDSKLLKAQHEKLQVRLNVLNLRKKSVVNFLVKCEDAKANAHAGISDIVSSDRRNIFAHNFVFHNSHLLWKKSIKNALYKLFELKERHDSLQMFLSNSVTKAMKKYFELFSRSDRKTEVLAELFGDPNNTTSQKQDAFNSPNSISRSNRLLHKLITERRSKYIVYNENYDENGVKKSKSKDSPKTDEQQKKSSEVIYGEKEYIPSSSEESPDFVANNEVFASNYVIHFLHPQINFEVEDSRDKRVIDSVIVGAENMQLKHIRIYDKPSVTNTLVDGQENIDISDVEPNRTRLILDVTNSQFHTVKNTDVKAQNSDLTVSKIIDTGVMGTGLWPVWIPLEMLIDKSNPDPEGYLNLVVERASATMHKEKPNPLYYNLKHDSAKNAESRFLFSFHNFIVSAKSSQYLSIYYAITKMIMSSSPARVKTEDVTQRVYFITEQLEKLDPVFDKGLKLQQKLRYLHQYLKKDQTFFKFIASDYESEEHTERGKRVARSLSNVQSELGTLITVLQRLKKSRLKNAASDDVGFLRIFVDKLVWMMLQDSNKSMCLWSLEDIDFTSKRARDKSASKTLTINKLRIENCMPSCPFTDLVGPYIPTKTLYNLFQRQHILRLYWRELPPVAGIEVIDHFEVNFFPLLLHLTYDSIMNIISYVYPDDAFLPQINSDELYTLYSHGRDYSSKTIRRRVMQMAPPEGEDGANGKEATTNTAKKGKQKDKKGKGKGHSDDKDEKDEAISEIKKMEVRANENKSYIYIKIPGVEHCLNYRGPRDKNIEDISMFVFKMQTLEFRNKTWTMLDMLDAIKKEVVKAVLANTGALVRDKLFAKKKPEILDIYT